MKKISLYQKAGIGFVVMLAAGMVVGCSNNASDKSSVDSSKTTTTETTAPSMDTTQKMDTTKPMMKDSGNKTNLRQTPRDTGKHRSGQTPPPKS